MILQKIFRKIESSRWLHYRVHLEQVLAVNWFKCVKIYASHTHKVKRISKISSMIAMRYKWNWAVIVFGEISICSIKLWNSWVWQCLHREILPNWSTSVSFCKKSEFCWVETFAFRCSANEGAQVFVSILMNYKKLRFS